MSRVIKFRVWDIPNERMIEEPCDFREAFDSYSKEMSDMEYAETWQDVEDGIWRSCFVMQYTGLKDRDGKEIWEGDILKHYLPYENSKEHPLVIMQWGSPWACFELKHINGLKNIAPINWYTEYTVIGNIYQNPELLK